MVTVSLILVAEALQAIVCILHMRGYINRHRDQLFKLSRSRQAYLESGEHDGRIHRYLSEHPRAIRLGSHQDTIVLEDKVLRCMNSLPQFKMSVQIMLGNLRIRDSYLRDDPSNKPNIVQSVSKINNSDLQFTQTK